MKKFLCLLTVGLLSLGLVACSSNDAGNSSDGGETVAPKPNSPFANTLVVGAPELTGSYTNGFGNSNYDRWIKDLIHGYALYTADENGEFHVDETVVSNVTMEVDEKGNKTYTFTLNDGLKWSDGTPVTAWDYAYNILLKASPEMANVGGKFGFVDGFLGYTDYNEGIAKTYEGVAVIDDKTIALTLDGEFLPYFYEVSYFAMDLEFPKHVLDPESELIADAETGVVTYVSAGAVNFGTVSEYISDTYRFNPTVTVGPYTFVSLDNNVATVKLNPEFAGDFRGKKPVIETVIVKTVNQTLDADLVIQGAENGGIDIAAGVIEGEKIEKIKASDQADSTTYYRNGFGHLTFHTDFGPVADKNVRQAVGYILDRNAFIQNVLGGYGVVTNGEYGLSQWVYQDNKDAVEEKLNRYTYNVETANGLLDETEWKFESDGKTAWDANKAAEGYYRYNDKGEVLEIIHAGTTENPVTDTIITEIPKGAAEVGIKYTIDQLDFATLLDHYYKGEGMGSDRRYHSFNLAVGFTPVNDPYYRIHSDFFGTTYNATQTRDEKMDRLTEELRSREPEDREGFSEKWLEYQIYWNDFLPQLPLYANQYFDVYNKRVSGVETTPDFSWALGIADIRLGE